MDKKKKTTKKDASFLLMSAHDKLTSVCNTVRGVSMEINDRSIRNDIGKTLDTVCDILDDVYDILDDCGEGNV
jgi:predicted small secreted protein